MLLPLFFLNHQQLLFMLIDFQNVLHDFYLARWVETFEFSTHIVQRFNVLFSVEKSVLIYFITSIHSLQKKWV